jgi:D-alanyl-D-alanine dipeptidase
VTIPRTRRSVLAGLGGATAAWAIRPGLVLGRGQGRSRLDAFSPPPAPCPRAWTGLLGRYGSEDGPLVRERGGRLELLRDGRAPLRLEAASEGVFRASAGERLAFARDARAEATSLSLDGATLPRRPTGVAGAVFRVTPRRPVDELRRRALALSPPPEPGPFRPVDLVDLTSLDPTLRLDVRYATSRNFLGVPVYPAARAFLQRPAALDLAAVHRSVASRGFGLLVHDAYRPWWVTKVFWDATPPDKREFVADPARGSRHNRGCAVDLTLYRLADGAAVKMPGVYDEMSERSYPGYPGGTSLERWHRKLLRAAMEARGFTVFESEWWHFDHAGWQEFPILNVPFDAVGP